MIKVSVIVPTYKPGEGLDRVVSSLDAQTMAQDEFEVIFVDDGSPDDTLQRLHAVAATRRNVRVTDIPNSGWPSRPRNVGLNLAEGEYVLFMDHDDYLYPDALTSAHGFGSRHRADAVNAKEVKTSSRFFAWPAFQADECVGREDVTPRHLLPMTPHKLYRRQFLLDHGISFREGDRRVMWEDIFFNVEVLGKAERIAVLSSVPFYKWVVGTGQNNSSSYTRDPAEYWDSLAKIFEYIGSGVVDAATATALKAHHYGMRVLGGMLGPGSLKRREEYYRQVLDIVPEFVDKYVPEDVDALLSKVDIARSVLLRAGRLDLLPALARADRGVKTVPTATEVRWDDDGALVVSCEVRWVRDDGSPLVLDERGGRLLRRLPEEVADFLADDVLDVTDELADGGGSLSLTSRRHELTWPMATTSEVFTETVSPGQVSLGVRVVGRVDVDANVFGKRLAEGVWDIACRSEIFGQSSYPLVRFHGTARVMLARGRVVTAFETRNGTLALDVGQNNRKLFADSRVEARAAQTRRVGVTGSRLRLPFADVATVGETRQRCELRLVERGRPPLGLPATLVADSDGARVEGVVRAPAGRYRIRVREPENGTVWNTPLVLRVSRLRRTALEVQGAGDAKTVWRSAD